MNILADLAGGSTLYVRWQLHDIRFVSPANRLSVSLCQWLAPGLKPEEFTGLELTNNLYFQFDHLFSGRFFVDSRKEGRAVYNLALKTWGTCWFCRDSSQVPIDPFTLGSRKVWSLPVKKISFRSCVTSQHGRTHVAMPPPPKKILINVYINFHVIEPFNWGGKSNLLFPTQRIILRGYWMKISTE